MSPIRGIDISHWQAQTPPLDGFAFVFARATYGTAVDDKYATHKRNVQDAGLVFGAYHFGRDMDGATQAHAFLHTIGQDVRLVALDYERDGDHGHMTPDQARIFIATVQASGRACGLYASESGYPHNLGHSWRWVAKWGTEQPTGTWAFWQYGGAPLDRDIYSGTAEQLRRMAGQEGDVKLTKVKGEDWKATGNVALFTAPDRTSPTVRTVPAGTVIRTIAEATGNDGGSWRLTEDGGVPAWFRYRNRAGAAGKIAPLVPGGDPATDNELTAYIARMPVQADCSAAIAADRAKARVSWD